MKKILERFAKWILTKTEKKNIIEKVNSLTKEPYVNDYFKKAMGEGNIDIEPLFILNDGTKVYQTKLAKASYETMIHATAEIPRQYQEYGLRKEKFYKFSELVRDEIQSAKELIRINPVECQDILTRSQDILLSLHSDFAFGDTLRMNLEIILCFLCTENDNPYVYDYEAKTELLRKILLEKDRLIPFIYALPLMSLLNTSDFSENDLASALSVQMKAGASAKLQRTALTIIDILNLNTKNQKFNWISQELQILTELSEVNTDTLVHTTI